MIALLFDTETTGLINNRTLQLDLQPEIIEFHGVIANLKTGKVSKKLSLLIKPAKPITAEITRITGITNKIVEKRPPFAKVAPSIFKMIEGAPMAIAHNLTFDREMVEIEAQRLGKKVTWPKTLCTVEQTVHIKGFRLTLTKLHEHLFNKTFDGAHRAGGDVAALLRCCVQLHKDGLI